MRLSRRKKKLLGKRCPYYFSISKVDWRNAWGVEIRMSSFVELIASQESEPMTRRQFIQKLEEIYSALKEYYL